MKLSVRLLAYNHAPYIAQAIEGILMQRVNFDYEIVIGEDESNDGTREIVADYARRYPELIRVHWRSRADAMHIDGKISGRFNFIETLRDCRGEYIAMLDGDDQWTDPTKLQTQVDFLEQHPHYSLSFHSVTVRFEEEGREIEGYVHQEDTYDVEDVISMTCSLPTCSVVFRRGTPIIPEWLDQRFPMGDLPLHVYNALRGPVGYVNKVMGLYRVHQGGIWTQGLTSFEGEEFEKWLARRRVPTVRFYEELAKVLPAKYRPSITKAISLQACELVWHYRKERNWQEMSRYWWRALRCFQLPGGFGLGFLFRTGVLSLLYRMPLTRPVLSRVH